MRRSDLNLLTPFWEFPACVRCAHCDGPIELAWSSSAVGWPIYDGYCYKEASCRA